MNAKNKINDKNKINVKNKIRATSIFIILLVFTIVSIELYAILDLYNNNIKVLALTKLKFDNYLRDFNKTYINEEYERRFQNFMASLKEIDRLNKLENRTVFGLTKFSDMSKEEFAKRLNPIPTCKDAARACNLTKNNNETSIYKHEGRKKGEKPKPSFDWRDYKGYVKPVLNQKQCQGCWAFSIVGVLETMSAKLLKDYNSRSIQELLDCSSHNNGCYGGNVASAMNYICDEKLMFDTEEQYPLTLAIYEKCGSIQGGGRRVRQFSHTCKMSEDLMVETIEKHGPLIVAVDSNNWMNYIGGIIRSACTRGVSNHVVQIVGYADYGLPDNDTIPYYIVRNSFGEDWGDNGYAKIAIAHGGISNVCGIAEQVTIIGDVY